MKNPIAQLWNRLVARPAAVLRNAVSVQVRSLTMAIHINAANQWRDLWNPLRGLTMTRAVSYLEEGERGAYADLQWLYRFIEKRQATLRGGKRSLLSAVTEMDWEIKKVEDKRLPAGYTPAQAEAQAVELRRAYDAISNLNEAIEFLGLAEFRGFAHLEMIEGHVPGWLDGQAGIVEMRPVEQWYWCREGRNGDWMYNEGARSGAVRGVPVDLTRFIVREIDDPINEIALIAFVRWQMGRKDEDGFIESFGVPSIFAVMPQNVPAGRETEYQDLAEQVISNSRGALPFGSDIKSVDPGARGTAPFRGYREDLEKEIVMAITSGALTMLAESGSGTLAGGAHSETFMRVVRALARRISETLRKQFDQFVLQRKFPGQPALAYFEILANEEVDTSAIIEDVAGLKSAGFDVDPAQVEERTSYRVSRAAVQPPSHGITPPLPNRAPAAAPQDEGAEPQDITDEMLAASLDGLLEGMQEDFKPVAARLSELLSSAQSEDELKAGVEKLITDLPQLAAEVGASEATVKSWREILGAAAANESVS